MTALISKLSNDTTQTTDVAATPAATAELSIDLINQTDPNNNCSDIIKQRLQLNLLSQSDHKLTTTKLKLETALKSELQKQFGISVVEEKVHSSPLVTVQQNFDHLLIPSHHYCRRSSDVYYVTSEILLRTHLTAYLYETFFNHPDLSCCVVAGPVYRRIEEDSIHSELSHQLEFVHLVDSTSESTIEIVSSIVKGLLPSDSKLRWEESDEVPYIVDAFSSLETLFNDTPIEIARFGILSPEVCCLSVFVLLI